MDEINRLNQTLIPPEHKTFKLKMLLEFFSSSRPDFYIP